MVSGEWSFSFSVPASFQGPDERSQHLADAFTDRQGVLDRLVADQSKAFCEQQVRFALTC